MNLLIIRLIIFVVLFWAGLKLYRMYREWRLEQDNQRHSLDSGKMVRCAYCKVHLPEDEALRKSNQWFCSLQHRDLFIEEQHRSQD